MTKSVERLRRGLKSQGVRVSLFLIGTAALVAVLLLAPAQCLRNQPVEPWIWLVVMVCFAFVSLDVALCVATQCSLWLICRGINKKVATIAIDTVDPVESVLTAFVVPALLKDEVTVRRLVSTLANHAMANWTPGVFFGLLTDFVDAPMKRSLTDDGLLEIASAGIDTLNAQCFPGAEQRFFLLHRDRCWSPAQGTWMGYERKRGKLNDLNDYIATGDLGRFTLARGSARDIVGARFVITLDEDNTLESGGAKRLIQYMTGHLGIPVVYRNGRAGIQGCAIVQPLPVLPEGFVASTKYQRMLQLCWSDAERLELVYEMLFNEGSFVGKGIYSVEAFRAILGGRFPDDTILSHDVIEGCFLRSRLLTDVQMSELPLRTYEVEMARTHRWNRGDWQAWLYAIRKNVRSELSLLAHWKLGDYARRAVVPGAVFLIILYATSYDSSAFCIAGIVISLRFLQLLSGWVPPSTSDLIGRQVVTTVRQKCSRVLAELLRELLYITSLPSLAWSTCSAAAKASWRLLYSGKNTLEWKTATSSADESLSSQGLVRNIFVFTPNLAAVAVVGVYGVLAKNVSGTTIIFLCLWLLGPVLSWWLSRAANNSGLCS